MNPLIDKVAGIEGLTRLIVDYPLLSPDVEIRRIGEPEAVCTFVRYPWRLSSSARVRMLGRDFGRVLDGTDVIEFNDGAIKALVSFFGSMTCWPSCRTRS